MNRIILISMLFIGMVTTSVARQGYHIQLKVADTKDSMVYLTHYYGKGLPSIFKRDSARFDKNGVAVFSSKDTAFVGGIYMMLLSDRKTYFEFLLDKGDDMTLTADLSKLPEGLKFKNSPENERFQEYVHFLKAYGTGQQELQKEIKEAKTAADTAAVRRQASASAKELTKYRRDYAKKYPNTMLANVFNALETPQVPEGEHFFADGKTKDTTFAYTYYKAHFWEGFNFQDDRLIHAPVFDGKLDEYFNKVVVPWPDSMEREADMLLRKTRGTTDLFKYTLWWLTRNVENSKIMGMDEVFVYLVENYYMKGDAFWLKNEDLAKYIDRAQKIAPNVIGNLCPELRLPNIFTKKEESIMGTKAPYTLVIFYSPTCGHCQHELPEIDSLYDAVLKAKGVKVITVATEGEEKAITDFLEKIKVDKKWINTWDHEHVSDYHNKFDVYSTPTIYLLDEKKIIRGKRLDHTNILGVMEMTEKMAKDKAKTNLNK